MYDYGLKKLVSEYESRNIPTAVYGTLREGQSNHGLIKHMIKMQHAKKVGDCTIPGTCIVSMGTLPSLYVGSGATTVSVAELYMISSEALAVLDVFEGHPRFYSRVDLSIIMEETGEHMRAVVYQGPALAIEAVRVISTMSEDGESYISDWAMRNQGTIEMRMSGNLRVRMPRNEELDDELILPPFEYTPPVRMRVPRTNTAGFNPIFREVTDDDNLEEGEA